MNPSQGIDSYMERFLEWSASMNYSQATIKNRHVGIRRFGQWCEQRSLNRPQEVTLSILERYQLYLYHYRKRNGDPLSFSTQHGLLAPLKAFFKWLAKGNHILYNPASEFQLPKVPKHLPRHILSIEEINDMLRHTQIYGDRGIRDRAMMETFYSTGIRKMELANLKMHDIDLKRGVVTIYDGKGKQDRVVPIGERAVAWVKQYQDNVRPQLMNDDDQRYLFLTDHGEPFFKNRASDLVKKYKDAVGIEKPGACHLFRHAMATHMLENGADTRYIQMMLGHKNLSSTEIYTHVAIKKLIQVHAATHPAKK